MMQPTPLRPDDQVAGGFIRMSLGGQPKRVPVLVVADNRAWTEKFDATVRHVLGGVTQLTTIEDAVQALVGAIDQMVDLLVAYDQTGVLGGKDWIDRNATDREVYEALKKVTDAAFPFGIDLMARIPRLIPMLLEAAARGVSSVSTSTSPPSTAGRRARSKRRSPTSS